MRREFLDEVGVRQNVYVGVFLGLLLAGLRLFFAVRINTNRSVLLSFALSVVLFVVVAMAVTILLTIARWFILGMKPEARNWKQDGVRGDTEDSDE